MNFPSLPITLSNVLTIDLLNISVLVVIETYFIIHFVILALFSPFLYITKRQVNKSVIYHKHRLIFIFFPGIVFL